MGESPESSSYSGHRLELRGLIVKLKSICKWTTKDGTVRTIRLHKAWRNLCGRVSGVNHDGRGNKRWLGLANDFRDWTHFRTWAIANEYSKQNNSLHRKDSSIGYSPTNCQWITRQDNTSRAMQLRWAKK